MQLPEKLCQSLFSKQAFYHPQAGYYLAPTAAAAATPFHPAAAGNQVALPGAHPAAAAASYYYGGYSAAYPYAAAGRLVSTAPVLALGV